MMTRAKGTVIWLSCVCLAVPAIGQTLEIGSQAPKLEVSKWVKGQPVDLGASKGKQITVVEFWATWCAPCIESIPHLTALQHEYANKGVRIVGVSRLDDRGNTLEAVEQFVGKWGDKMGYAVAFDKDGGAYDAYMTASGQQGIPTAFVVDKGNHVAWIGHPLTGLDDVLAELIAGTYNIEVAKKYAKLQAKGQEAWFEGDMEKVLKLANEAIALRPTAYDPRRIKFDTLANYLEKHDQAKACAKEALKIWADRPSRVAEFAADVLISDHDEHGYNTLALKALRRTLTRAPDNVDLHVAHFQALAAVGQDARALSAATEAVTMMKGDATRLSRFAHELSSPARARLCGDLALKAVALAIELEPDVPGHLLTKFQILNECQKDIKGATITGQYLIQKAAGDANFLNGFAWNLLDKASMKGKFNELALAAAEAMFQSPGGDHWMMLDTLALAKFENGAVDEAIKIQKKAVEQCDNDRALNELKGRLEQFEAAGGK